MPSVQVSVRVFVEPEIADAQGVEHGSDACGGALRIVGDEGGA